MKVLRIIARLNVGGPAKHVVWLTDRLRRRGFESVLVAGSVPEGEDDMSWFADQNGVAPVYLREMSRELSPRDIVSLVKLFRIIRAEKPDIIHTHTAKAGTLGRIAALFHRLLGGRKVKVVHTFHGHVLHSYYGRGKTALFRAIERALARVATDKIVVISPQQLDEINAKFHVGRREQFTVIPLGMELADPPETSDLRAQLPAGPETILIGCIGRLAEIKDIPLLIRSVAEIPGDANLHLVVVGDGHIRADLERLAMELNSAGKVTFLGNRTDIANVLAGLDIVALTSLNEGTPLSLIEAMGAARPVAATPVGGVVDLLGRPLEAKDGFAICERGISLSSREPRDIASALIYMAQNERLRESLSDAGREYVQANYSLDRLENDIVALYEELGNA
ncbi:MAG TPA: glycosyltransferase [Pyrinomonadaceae bacterium]|jgi:glycosyltransferase involved in cell wall biosynthesis|nr:glycosyltransferase [Pyrinomonadaceae bacterium]